VTRALALLCAVPLCTGCLAFHRGAMPGEPADATFAQVDDTRVRYRDQGKGPAVVLIHGFGSALDTWDLLAPQLVKAGRRAISLDLKGFGWTDRPEGDYSPTAQAVLVISLLDKLGVDKFAIVAHSWGSSVSLQIALMVPERVTRLALFDAWAYEEQLPTTFYWARAPLIGEIIYGVFYDQLPEMKLESAFFDKRFVTQKLVDDVERAYERPGTKAAALAAVRGMRYAEVQKRYSSIRQPVMLMYGREDVATPVSFGERLVTQLPNATLEVFPRCGHLPMIEAAAATTTRVLRFLEEER